MLGFAPLSDEPLSDAPESNAGAAVGTSVVSGLRGSIGSSDGSSVVSASNASRAAAEGDSIVAGLSGSVGSAVGSSADAGSLSVTGQAVGSSVVSGLRGSVAQAIGTGSADAIALSSGAVGSAQGRSVARAVARRSAADTAFIHWMRRDNAVRVVLVEMQFQYELGGAPVTGTLYLSDHAYFDNDVPRAYVDCVHEVPNFFRSINDLSAGSYTATVGSLELDNADGDLDFLLDLACDGSTVSFYYGDEDWDRSDFYFIFSALVERVTAPSFDRLSVQLNDVGLLLDKSIGGSVQVGGTGPNVERFRPFNFGYVHNLEFLLQDKATLTYVHSDTGDGTLARAVRDRGASVTFFDNGDGTVTLSASPDGTITGDIRATPGGFFAYRTSDAMDEIAVSRAGLSSPTQYAGAGITFTIGDDQDYILGVTVGDARNVIDLLNSQLCLSGNCFWGVTRDGRYTYGRLRLNDIASFGLEPIEIDDVDNGSLKVDSLPPQYYQYQGYMSKNWLVQTDLAFALDPDEQGKYRRKGIYLLQEIPSGTTYLDAPQLYDKTLQVSPVVETVLSGDHGDADLPMLASWMAVRRAMLLPWIDVISFRTGIEYYATELGDPVLLDVGRFGTDGGALFQCTGINIRLSDAKVELTVARRRVQQSVDSPWTTELPGAPPPPVPWVPPWEPPAPSSTTFTEKYITILGGDVTLTTSDQTILTMTVNVPSSGCSMLVHVLGGVTDLATDEWNSYVSLFIDGSLVKGAGVSAKSNSTFLYSNNNFGLLDFSPAAAGSHTIVVKAKTTLTGQSKIRADHCGMIVEVTNDTAKKGSSASTDISYGIGTVLASCNITVADASSHVKVILTAGLKSAGSTGSSYLRIRVDGTTVYAGVQNSLAASGALGPYGSVSALEYISLSAGAHTIELLGQTDGPAHVVDAATDTYNHAALYCEEVPTSSEFLPAFDHLATTYTFGGSYTTMLTKTITVEADRFCFVTFSSAVIPHVFGQSPRVSLVVDGSPVVADIAIFSARGEGSGFGKPLCAIANLQLSAGSHTIEMQGKTDGPSATADTSTISHGALMIEQVPICRDKTDSMQAPTSAPAGFSFGASDGEWTGSGWYFHPSSANPYLSPLGGWAPGFRPVKATITLHGTTTGLVVITIANSDNTHDLGSDTAAVSATPVTVDITLDQSGDIGAVIFQPHSGDSVTVTLIDFCFA